MAAENLKKENKLPAEPRLKTGRGGNPLGELEGDEGTVFDTTGQLDIPYLVLTLLLVAIGLLMLFSASYARAIHDTGNAAYYFVRQTIFAVLGIGAMLLISRLNYFIFHRLSMLILAGSIVLLMMVLVVGTEVNGAKRWVVLFGQRFQPSEIAKFAVVLSFASMMSVWKDKMQTFQYGVLPYAVILGIIMLMLVIEKHLSAILIIVMLGATMMFLGGTQKRWFLIGAAVMGLFFLYYITSKGYAGSRITTWLDPYSDAQGDGYQTIQSQYAIGSGGFLGLGFGHSRQKYLYLPEEHNDYIFAIVCEELGFVGVMGILLLFVLLILRGYWIALHARDRFGTLTAAGLTTLLAVQVFLNMGVVSNLLPPTGISLPFFSYGGTALLMQLGEMGIVLSISRWCTNKEIRKVFA